MQLYQHQKEALESLKNGNILNGDVGSGKSLTAIAWYYCKLCGGEIEPVFKPMSITIPLIIITTAKKRDDTEWEKELARFLISTDKVVIDSWNNIKKYVSVSDSCFIFDEQRLVGNGTWVKSFLKIAKRNKWILLTATPGDQWTDFIPVFIANGFYKNRTDFYEQHCEFDPFTKFRKIKRYHNVGKLIKLKKQITIRMKFDKPAIQIHKNIICQYNKDKEKNAIKTRWDPYKNEPMSQAFSLCYVLRRIVNEDPSRIAEVWKIHVHHPRVIIFYNFDYELNMLKQMCDDFGYTYAEWNGHKHENVPSGDRWLYLVQYMAGNEGWNCTLCSTMVFYSSTYSYKTMVQAAGRIDRLNTPFKELYYYHLTSNSIIDRAINNSLNKKKKFNEKSFEENLKSF